MEKALLEKIDVEDLRDLQAKAVRDLCDQSYYNFIRIFWGTVNPDPYVDNWHIRFLCAEIQHLASFVLRREPKPYDLVVNIPPSTSKSSICSIFLVPWLWSLDPSLTVIAGSYGQSLALSLSRKSRAIIESDLYRRVYGGRFHLQRDNKAVASFATSENGERIATSTGAAITGKHAHIIVIDDPIKPLEALSETVRETASAWLSGTLATRKKDARITPTILVMQRLHEADPTGELLGRATADNPIRHICLPAEDDAEVRPASVRRFYVNGLLDPNRLGESTLRGLRSLLSAYDYAGQYRQTPMPMGGALIKAEWLEVVPCLPVQEGERTEPVFFFLDTAYTGNEKNDPSAILSCVKINNILYITRVAQVWRELPGLVRFVRDFCESNGYSEGSKVYIEPKASGKSLKQVLAAETLLNVVEDAPPDRDKISRVNSILPKLEGGRVKLVKGPWVGSFVGECTAFPNSRHDDQVDVLVMSVKKILSGFRLIA